MEGLEAYRQRYREAIERVLPELPVENGTITIDSIWVETSLPRDLIIEIVKEGGLALPLNVEQITVEKRKS
ncbi:MAG: hypothetical protein GWO44_25025 [Thermoplasmata archaeon]|nr:hypothetical protein [Thermoplasmata archaeon]NIY06439.1 hypothetical protein [Thermoplasmata archaeon]